MLLPTDEIIGLLKTSGLEVDGSYPFGNVGYREKNGGWLMIDEGSSLTDTDFLVQDCVAGKCYATAALIQKYVRERSKKKD